MTDTLSTLVQHCHHHAEIRKSRFLAQAAAVTSAGQALAFVRDVSDPVATHNCWAYRIAQDYRFNDDGEPGGTAGRPILQAIEGQQMDGVAVVVTRWYGGIKLGAGGLARAYGGTAAECLRLAEREPIVAMTRLGVRCDFSEFALLRARLKDLQATIETEQFDADGVELTLCLPAACMEQAGRLCSDLTSGRGLVRQLG
jgi:uncharacterized YigZ family protein